MKKAWFYLIFLIQNMVRELDRTELNFMWNLLTSLSTHLQTVTYLLTCQRMYRYPLYFIGDYILGLCNYYQNNDVIYVLFQSIKRVVTGYRLFVQIDNLSLIHRWEQILSSYPLTSTHKDTRNRQRNVILSLKYNHLKC